MKTKEMLETVVERGKREDMYKLNEMLDNLICDLKTKDPKMYHEYKDDLYELAFGKKISDQMAYDWVHNMKPEHEHWTLDETTSAMRKMGYNCDRLEFYVVANMMYNDFYEVVKDNQELALSMAYLWLDDEDAKEGKLYNYYKNIPKRD